MVTASTITPDMLRRQRDDAIAHPERYPNYRDAVIRYATWAIGETTDVAGVDCSLLGCNWENCRQIALEDAVRTWNWRAAEDARLGITTPTDLDLVLRNLRNGDYLPEQLPPAIVKLIERVRELEVNLVSAAALLDGEDIDPDGDKASEFRAIVGKGVML